MLLIGESRLVVSDEVKGVARRRQVGSGKTNASESLMMCRNENLASKPGRLFGPGMDLAGER
jgi:hypothetical protein